MSGGVEWAQVCADPAVLAAHTLPSWVRRAREAQHTADLLRTSLSACGLPTDAVVVTDGPGSGWRVGRSADGWCAQCGGIEVGGTQATVRDAAALALGRVLLDVVRPEGPFEPGPADPPLSLLRRLRRVVLPVGATVDRLGESSGTFVWVAHTPWPLRSLPREHGRRPYAAFTLRRGVEALAGEAVPWFGQPGGGTAFVLPCSVARLVAMGALEPLV
ncbi:MAG: TNT domain-containing protein [Mycobacteriaceae bacterium]